MARQIEYHSSRAYSWLLLVVLLFGGCVSSVSPRDDSGFSGAAGLSAFQGCYKNCSDTSDGGASICLSSIVWPGEFTEENRPEAVRIVPEGDDALVVSAFSKGRMLKRSRFTAGKDFQFKDGRIELEKQYHGSTAAEPGNPFIGIATTQTVLGLDRQGQGRVRQTSSFAGTGFLIIPVVGKGSDIGRIQRVDGLCGESGR